MSVPNKNQNHVDLWFESTIVMRFNWEKETSFPDAFHLPVRSHNSELNKWGIMSFWQCMRCISSSMIFVIFSMTRVASGKSVYMPEQCYEIVSWNSWPMILFEWIQLELKEYGIEWLHLWDHDNELGWRVEKLWWNSIEQVLDVMWWIFGEIIWALHK